MEDQHRHPLAALFLVTFDVRSGYKIVWKRLSEEAEKAGLIVEGEVEYRCLPSGLHSVSEDIVYFNHAPATKATSTSTSGGKLKSNSEYVGVGAFRKLDCDDASLRNARMVSVGVLIPAEAGKLGKPWQYADSMKALASTIVQDTSQTHLLDTFWNQQLTVSSATDIDTVQNPSPLTSPLTSETFRHRFPSGSFFAHAPKSSLSDLDPPTNIAREDLAGCTLSHSHPAWSLTSMVDLFGPLLFPIHRAALLRKRILISGRVPVQEACHFVYNISLLSNIPLQVHDLDITKNRRTRLRPLYSIGVHDLTLLLTDPQLSSFPSSLSAPSLPPDGAQNKPLEPFSGWVACTTDSILATKTDLWDVLITLPERTSVPTTGFFSKKLWPKVQFSNGTSVVATQHDAVLYRRLKSRLIRTVFDAVDSPTEHHHNIQREHPAGHPYKEIIAQSVQHIDEATGDILEPKSWAALAYESWTWCAAGGLALETTWGWGSDASSSPLTRSRDEYGFDTGAEEELISTREALIVSIASLAGRYSGHGGPVASCVLRPEQELVLPFAPPGDQSSNVGTEEPMSTSTSVSVSALSSNRSSASSSTHNLLETSSALRKQARQRLPLLENEEIIDVEVAVILFFHRQTSRYFTTLANTLQEWKAGQQQQRSDLGQNALSVGPRSREAEAESFVDEANEGEDAHLLGHHDREQSSGSIDDTTDQDATPTSSSTITSLPTDLPETMSLDSWSPLDREFIHNLAALYFDANVEIASTSWEICGLRVC